jgi:hypothetical protein
MFQKQYAGWMATKGNSKKNDRKELNFDASRYQIQETNSTYYKGIFWTLLLVIIFQWCIDKIEYC